MLPLSRTKGDIQIRLVEWTYMIASEGGPWFSCSAISRDGLDYEFDVVGEDAVTAYDLVRDKPLTDVYYIPEGTPHAFVSLGPNRSRQEEEEHQALVKQLWMG